MNLHAYLSKHDGKPRPHGSELVRLALVSNISPYYLYLTALGHKRVGEDTARELSANSINGELAADQINKQSDT
jgi:hypothetical protein